MRFLGERPVAIGLVVSFPDAEYRLRNACDFALGGTQHRVNFRASATLIRIVVTVALLVRCEKSARFTALACTTPSG